eukprot:18558-Amorphochlora_amoeboformis.AAC.1
MASRAGRARRRARVQRCLPLAAILFLATALSAVPSRSCVPRSPEPSVVPNVPSGERYAIIHRSMILSKSAARLIRTWDAEIGLLFVHTAGPPPARPPSEIRFRDRFGEKFGPLLEQLTVACAHATSTYTGQREAKKQMIKEKEREKYIKIPLDIPVQNITGLHNIPIIIPMARASSVTFRGKGFFCGIRG